MTREATGWIQGFAPKVRDFLKLGHTSISRGFVLGCPLAFPIAKSPNPG